MMDLIFLFALGIGFVAGLRSLTAPAAVAWAAHAGWLQLKNTPLSFMGMTVTVAIFSVLAIGELVADKLPITPRRTEIAPLLVRIVMGGLCGACLFASSHHSLGVGALIGGVGGAIGAFAGYEIRRRVVTSLRIRDLFVAIAEDIVAVSLAIFLLAYVAGTP